MLSEIGSQLIQISNHSQGSDVAVDGSYGIRQGRRTGVAPIGVAHGLSRPIPGSRPQALIRDRRVPILAVTLEHIILDLDEVRDAAVGDVVLLLGREHETAIELDELAAWFGMSELDTVMALSGRLKAYYRGATNDAAGPPPYQREVG